MTEPREQQRRRATAAHTERSRRGLSRQAELAAGLSIWGHPRERIGPLTVLLLSLVVCFGQLALLRGSAAAVAGYGVALLVTVALMVTTAFLAAPLLQVSFGVVGLAVLRLTAVVMGGEALDSLTQLFPSDLRPWLSLGVWAVTFFGLMKLYFDLTFKEIVQFLVLLWVVRFLVSLLAVYLSLRLGLAT